MQRVGGGEHAHRRGDDLAADDGREQYRPQFQVADVAGEALGARNAAAGLVGPPGQGTAILLGVVAGRARGEGLVVVVQPQVLVAVDRLQVGGDSRG